MRVNRAGLTMTAASSWYLVPARDDIVGNTTFGGHPGYSYHGGARCWSLYQVDAIATQQAPTVTILAHNDGGSH